MGMYVMCWRFGCQFGRARNAADWVVEGDVMTATWVQGWSFIVDVVIVLSSSADGCCASDVDGNDLLAGCKRKFELESGKYFVCTAVASMV